MGLTHVAVEVRNFRSTDSWTANFLVDTGALDSMAPASELKRVGIEPMGKNIYELANGELQEYEYGFAQLSFMDERTPAVILFGPDNTEPLLGVLTLEAAGFLVDTKNQTIRKLRALPLKRVAAANIAIAS